MFNKYHGSATFCANIDYIEKRDIYNIYRISNSE